MTLMVFCDTHNTIYKQISVSENMDQLEIGELNKRFKIYYPYEEISIYLRQSKLSDSPIPAFADLFNMPVKFYPTKYHSKVVMQKKVFRLIRRHHSWSLKGSILR